VIPPAISEVSIAVLLKNQVFWEIPCHVDQEKVPDILIITMPSAKKSKKVTDCVTLNVKALQSFIGW
jgi:hypothetical protein